MNVCLAKVKIKSISLTLISAKQAERTLSRSMMEAIRLEVVSAEILAVVVRRNIINMDLITIFDVVEEEMDVSEIKN